MAKFVILLNMIILSPLSQFLGDESAIILRCVQILTLVSSLQYMRFEKTGNNTNTKLVTILISLFVLIFISEIFHTPKDYISLLRHLSHVFYIIGLIFLLKHISREFMRKCLMFLTFSYLLEVLAYIFINGLGNIGTFIDLNRMYEFKRFKYELEEYGYSLSSFHIIPFVTFWILPYLRSVKRQLILLGVASFIMVLSFTFTALISYIAVCLVYLYVIRKKRVYSAKFLLNLFLAGGGLIAILICFFPMELFQITTGRATLWEQAVKMIVENPMWGCSMEEFYNSIDSYLISGSFAKYINYDYIGGMFEFTTGSCHNIYLGMCMNYGIPLGILYIVMIFTMWKIAINRTKNMIYLLPFLYLLIRGFGEFGGIIGSSNANLDFLFDIYIISLISIPNINNENKFKNSISVIS